MTDCDRFVPLHVRDSPHQAVHWDAYTRRWVFLPRKATVNTKYDPRTDETQGTNFLIVASENFGDIQVRCFQLRCTWLPILMPRSAGGRG